MLGWNTKELTSRLPPLELTPCHWVNTWAPHRYMFTRKTSSASSEVRGEHYQNRALNILFWNFVINDRGLTAIVKWVCPRVSKRPIFSLVLASSHKPVTPKTWWISENNLAPKKAEDINFILLLTESVMISRWWDPNIFFFNLKC